MAFSCHIVGLNPYTKKELYEKLNDKNFNKTFNIIDLDSVNQEILKKDDMDRMYRQYMKLKLDKNDKYKEVEKKMSNYWESNFVSLIESKINTKKSNIFIGQNNHYKSSTKKVPIECNNKFIINSQLGNNFDDEIKKLIQYNLETYKDDIISGNFPLEYIDYAYLHKKRINLDSSYKKSGYIEKTFEQLLLLFSLIEVSKTKNSEIWISMKEPYNIGSLIHPTDKVLKGYSDPNVALLESTSTSYIKTGDDIMLRDTKNMKTKRFLYLVEASTFIPDEDTHEIFISQLPVKIISKTKIDNVYEHFTNK